MFTPARSLDLTLLASTLKFMDLMMTKWTSTPWYAPFAIDQNQHSIHVAVKALIHNVLAYIAILIVITLSCTHVLMRLTKLKLQQLLSIHQAPQHDHT